MSYKAESLHPYIMNNRISVLSSQNETQTQDIIDIKGSLNSINDNLSGFKFYPTGTQIVGLISDDSAYKDANGNYVIWGTATANQLVADNPDTYKSVSSTEDTRGEVGADTATPFKGGIDWTNNHYLTSDYNSGTDKTYSPTVTIDSGIETFMIFVYGYTQYGSLYYNLVTATNATKLSSRSVSNGYYYIFKKTNKNLSSTVKANNTAPFNHVGAYGMVAISLDS